MTSIRFSSSGKTLVALYRGKLPENGDKGDEKVTSANCLIVHDVAAMLKGLADRTFDVEPIFEHRVENGGFVSADFSDLDQEDRTLLLRTEDGDVSIVEIPSMESKVRGGIHFPSLLPAIHFLSFHV